MSRFNFGTYALFLAITLWGILLGGIVYSHVVYFPPYLSDLPASAVVVNGKYGLNEAPFWLSIHPLLILSLIVSLVLNWKYKQRRRFIAISFGIYAVILIISNIYFIPELGAFKHSPESNIAPEEWLPRAKLWMNLSLLRGAIMLYGFFPLLVALIKPADAARD